jgi:hypothetical protein
MRRGAFTVVLVLAFVSVAAAPVSAEPLDRVAGSVSGNNDFIGRDGTCAISPFLPVEMPHSVIEGTVARHGPDAHFRVDLCNEVSGALGGTCYEGTFIYDAKEGSLNGVGIGCQSSAPFAPMTQFITIIGGTRAYAHARDMLLLRVCFAGGRGGPSSDGTLSTGFLIVAPPDVESTGGPPLDCRVFA